MEFKEVGVVPYQAPAEHLKPFFRKKYKTIFRSLPKNGGVITNEFLMEHVKKFSDKFPEDKKVEVEKRHLEEIWPFIMLHGKDSINEEEYVESWMEKVSTDPASRKENMEKTRRFLKDVFDTIDKNRNGFIDLEELQEGKKIYDTNGTLIDLIFNALDADGDKRISFAEWEYAIINHNFNSGPDSVYSLYFGRIVD